MTTDTIVSDSAEDPKSVDTGQTKVESRPIQELVMAESYLKGKESAASRGHGLRFFKLVPPGAS